ncbi:MAG: hypothetical protein ACOCZD_00780 [Haloferacaceae archaeon]
MDAEHVGAVSATLVAVGLGVAVLAITLTGWAEATFVTGAGGNAAEFGPIFVAQSYLGVTAAALLGAPVVAGVAGLVVGTRTFGPVEAAASAGIGAALGSLGYVVVVIGLVVLLQGPAADQAYGFLDALGPAAGTVLVSTLVAAASGVVGTWVG